MIGNERLKLQANYLNGLAIAVFAIGGLAPLSSVAYGENSKADALVLGLGVGICLVASYALHLLARRVLKGLTS
ncbi:hypothetical protein [Lutibaculum baratangense]|uniref:hypothetical protein n=1 Tax=Lutibaculum baratangense TaxID=1358440 RepID=UPI00058AC778|nr:hypothetical protein [Lutibaculum baratangense]